MYHVFFTPTAKEMLLKINNTDTRATIIEKARGLAEAPEKQGIALVGPLRGFRRIPAAGRYRVIYRVGRLKVEVHVVAVGLRKQGDNTDIYELAQRLARLGLLGEGATSPKKK
jgi:mRNA-degrading endonuclease RelE of RelBE toxin-antitoxin system